MQIKSTLFAAEGKMPSVEKKKKTSEQDNKEANTKQSQKNKIPSINKETIHINKLKTASK